MLSKRQAIAGLSIISVFGGILVVAQLVIAALSIAAMFAMGWVACAIVAIILNVLWIVTECTSIIVSNCTIHDLSTTEMD